MFDNRASTSRFGKICEPDGTPSHFINWPPIWSRFDPYLIPDLTPNLTIDLIPEILCITVCGASTSSFGKICEPNGSPSHFTNWPRFSRIFRTGSRSTQVKPNLYPVRIFKPEVPALGLLYPHLSIFFIFVWQLGQFFSFLSDSWVCPKSQF